MRSRRVLVPVLVIAVLVAASIGVWRWRSSGPEPVKAPSTIAEYVGNGPRVAILGDSITYVSIDAINAAMRPDYAVAITAAPGIKADAQHITAERYVPTKPSIVVIALGTNDALQGDSTEDYQDAMASMIKLFPKSCVIVATLTTKTGTEAFSARAVEYDTYLRTLPHVMDWDAAVNGAEQAGHAVMADEVHPNAEGQQLFAKVMAQAVNACPTRSPQP